MTSYCGVEPGSTLVLLTEIKELAVPRPIVAPPQHWGFVMTTGGILFLILVLAATGVFAGVLAYYSRG